MAPRLALHDVGEVHLDDRDPRYLERVADRPRVVRPRAGVDDHAVGDLLDAVQVLDELTLGVRLKEARVELELAREAVDRMLELAERDPAVVARVAPPE